MTIYPPNAPTDEGVARISREMELLGPPTIRVMLHRGRLHAIEGSHRLAAAKRLRVRPVVVVVADETTDLDQVVHAIDDHGPRTQTVGNLSLRTSTKPRMFDRR